MYMKQSIITLFVIIIFSCSKDSSYKELPAKEAFEDGDVEIVFENQPTNAVHVVFIGEGFTKEDLTNGAYQANAKAGINFLFDDPLFAEYKDDFNAYIVYLESNDSGTSSLGQTPKETALSIVMDYNGFSIYDVDYDAIEDYVKLAVPNFKNEDPNVIVLVSLKGTNTGSGWDGIAYFRETGGAVLVHEVGHAFASLADEYVNADIGLIDPDGDGISNVEGLANVDVTNNLDLVKWNHFIGLEGYEGVGVFEGGYYVDSGVWRPEYSSIMGNQGGPSNQYFNAPSREAIVRRIKEIRGLPFDFEEFVERDEFFRNGYFKNTSTFLQQEHTITDLKYDCTVRLKK